MSYKWFKLYTFNPSTTNLETVHTQIKKLLNDQPSNIQVAFLISIHELVINSIQESNHLGLQNEISIALFKDETLYYAWVSDYGRGISNTLTVKLSDDLLKERGRGLEIVQSLSDCFYVCKGRDQLNYFIITKNEEALET